MNEILDFFQEALPVSIGLAVLVLFFYWMSER